MDQRPSRQSQDLALNLATVTFSPEYMGSVHLKPYAVHHRRMAAQGPAIIYGFMANKTEVACMYPEVGGHQPREFVIATDKRQKVHPLANDLIYADHRCTSTWQVQSTEPLTVSLHTIRSSCTCCCCIGLVVGATMQKR